MQKHGSGNFFITKTQCYRNDIWYRKSLCFVSESPRIHSLGRDKKYLPTWQSSFQFRNFSDTFLCTFRWVWNSILLGNKSQQHWFLETGDLMYDQFSSPKASQASTNEYYEQPVGFPINSQLFPNDHQPKSALFSTVCHAFLLISDSMNPHGSIQFSGR